MTTAQGGWAFVSLDTTIGVVSLRTFAPRVVQQIAVPGHPQGEVLTHDGRDLLVADDSGLALLDVVAAERGRPSAVRGLLTSPGGGAAGAVEVAVSPDDRYAFVTRESADDLAVFDLHRVHAGGSGSGSTAFVGRVPLGVAPVGLAVAPRGRWLYATSEARTAQVRRQGTGRRVTPGRHGLVTSPDGGTVWVTARGSDALLGFAAATLVRDPRQALVARVPVGAAPVGLIAVKNGAQIIVANSNRFAAPGAAGTLSVVDTAAALARRPALRGRIPAGGFPRQFALAPGDRVLLVTNSSSAQLEAVDLAALP